MWSSIVGMFSNCGSAGGGWAGLAQSFTSNGGGSSILSQLPNLLSSFGGSQGSTTDAGNSTSILGQLPNLLSGLTGSQNSTETTDAKDDKDDKFSKFLDISLRMPGSGQESKTGKTMSKIGRPIGSVIGSIWGPIGSMAGGEVGEDAFGKIGDTIKLFS